MRKVYLGTIITEFLTMCGQLISYKLAAAYLGKDGFSEYALAKRTISLLLPVALLGLAVAIPRYVAFSGAEALRKDRNSYFAAGMVILAVSLAASLGLLNVFKHAAAYLFFGSSSYSYLIAPMSIMVAGLGLHAVCYGYFRGRLEMARANAFQFFNLGLMPLGVFPLFGKSAPELFTALGVSMAAVSLVFGLGGIRMDASGGDIFREIKELLKYGLGRVPADILQLALLTGPALIAAHLQGVQVAGLVAFSTSILTMIGSLFVPVGAVLLPEASQMMGRGDVLGLRRRVLQVSKAVVLLVAALTVAVELFAADGLRLCLGNSFTGGAGIVRIVVLAAVPYSIYVGLKTVLDAGSTKAINSRNALLAFLLFLGASASVYIGLFPAAYILGFFVASLYVLGGLTLLEVREMCGGRLTNLPELAAETFVRG
jgi:O-antigen/teichoic acid export membrane protein